MVNLESSDSLLQIAEVELTYKKKKKGTTSIKDSKSAVEIFRRVWAPDMEVRESFYVMYLNRRNNVMAVQQLSTGGVAGTVVDAKLLFSTALKMLCSGIILAHNHPSGATQPSTEDISLTKKIKDGAKLLEMSVLDHVILTDDAHFSFADEGLL